MNTLQAPLEKGFKKLYSPFQRFIQDQTTSSFILLGCVLVAMFIANSPWADDYQTLISLPLGVMLGDWSFKMSLQHWVNDGLMTYFFFLLGMEIKRELLVGEIRELNRLIPVAAAALGGMVAPALIYYGFNSGTPSALGWGIPMATDTAFALGVLVMLGKHVPVTTLAFLTALAIIDDIGAILVIALFYSESLSLLHLLVAGLLLGLLVIANAMGIKRPGFYLLMGFFVWLAMLGSGVHATVAGILVAATVPARAEKGPNWFMNRVKGLLKRFEKMEDKRPEKSPILAEEAQHEVVEDLKEAADKATTPLRRWERYFEHPVALFVLPTFALFNAGVSINLDGLGAALAEPLALGVIFGLLVGKGTGIPLFCWAVLKLNWGKLPTGMTFGHVIGVGLLGGMGFTMSMFISTLGFGADQQVLDIAKSGILLGTLLAGIGGYIWLKFFTNCDSKR